MGKKHKAPSGRRAHWYGGRYSIMQNLYVCPVCKHPMTPGEECPRCKKREQRRKAVQA